MGRMVNRFQAENENYDPDSPVGGTVELTSTWAFFHSIKLDPLLA